MNTEIKSQIKLYENKIFSCLLMNIKLLDEINLDEKYFTQKNILKIFYEEKENNGYIDKDSLSAKLLEHEELLNLIIENTEIEASPNHIFGYYNQLKELWYTNKINDLTELLNKRRLNRQQFYETVEQMQDVDAQTVLLNDDISISKNSMREYTEIKELDYLLKGIEYGKLSLWSGITNHGKTTLMTQFAKECIKQKKKIFYFSGEQSASEFKNYLYVGMCRKEQLEFLTDIHNTRIYDTVPKKEVIEYFDNIYKNMIYIYNNEAKDNTIRGMIRAMEYAYKQGVRIFFIDNFMQLDNSEHLEEQTKIVELFKRFARDKNSIVNLVAHPRKTQFNKCRLTIFDIAGTQNIANKSANICTIMRTDMLGQEYEEVGKILASHGYNIDKCDGIVEVIKTKGNSCKMVGLVYNKDTKTYIEAPKLTKEEKEYFESKNMKGNLKR